MLSFNKHVFFSALAVLVLASFVCFRFFGEIILHPNEFLFGASGDGLKNYFTVAYQVIHGEGTWFNGMLYPYGDHLIYADGQPLLTKILSWFIDPEVNNGGHVIGAMNLLKIGSLIITAWCVHRLLVWNYVNPWFAVPFALTIAFLSPQMARFTGHYALAYTCVIPIFWLLMESINRFKVPWLMAIITSFVVLLSGFIHPYYLFIFVIFLGFVLSWELLLFKFKIQNVTNCAARGFALITPLILFLVYQKLSDPYIDRPASPSGVFEYIASFQSVFVPIAEPFRSLFNSYFFRIFIPSSWEGEAYIGIVASFVAFASVLSLIKGFRKRRWKLLSHPVLPATLKSVFIPGILTLLFSMGLFHFVALDWLSDFISPLKQFRSLGRVAWIFYYVFSVWTAYQLYLLFRYFRTVANGKFSYHISVIIILCALVWMLDAIVNIKFNKAQILNGVGTEFFSDNYAKKWIKAGVVPSDYQAIMPLPLMLIGSEKISLENGDKSLKHAMIGSFSTGLPIIGGAMSRTSLDVTEKTAQLVANPLFPRPILKEFEKEKNLLLLKSNETLSNEENRLVANADLVFSNSDFQLYSISVDEVRTVFNSINFIPDSMEIALNGLQFHMKDVEESSEKLWGAKCYNVSPLEPILDTEFNPSDTMVLEYWISLKPKDQGLPSRIVSVEGKPNLEKRIDKNANLLEGWLLVSDTVHPYRSGSPNYSFWSRSGTISRIMFRKLGEDILHDEDGIRYFNNIPLR